MRSVLPLLHCLAASAIVAATPVDPPRSAEPLFVYCSTGDHLWPWERQPVDSPATVAALFEWLARTYGVGRVYWQGGQQEIWAEEYQVGKASPLAHDWTAWCNTVIRQARINRAAVRAARRWRMGIYLHTGLFEHGVQPDVGIICPYLVEDRLRIEHPEWCPRDRWGQRRCPGPLSFTFPEVRRRLIRRYLRHVTQHGYDGLSFYTYVENVGIRCEDEFGYEPPVIREFKRIHPNTDPTRDILTEQQRLDLHRCRGRFVTVFLRELHAALRARGKRLAVLLDARDPSNAQPWWGHPIPGTGSVFMDWETWAREGIVDELYVQLGDVTDQQATLRRILDTCAGLPVKLTVRATHPLQDRSWAPFVARGVTPISCITSPANDTERYALQPTGPEALRDPDWRLRAQTLADIAAGKLGAEAQAVATATRDPHVLVRRQALFALAELRDPGQVPTVEARLEDRESSVRIAAAVALGKLHGPHSAQRILDALRRDHNFQMKEVCVATLGAMGGPALPVVARGAANGPAPVREVCVRALYQIGRAGHPEGVHERLLSIALDRGQNETVRYWAVDGLLGARVWLPKAERDRVAAQLISLTPREPSALVQLHLAFTLGYLQELLDAPLRRQALDVLVALLGEYGDLSRREDAAYGWRVVGNAIHQFGEPGDSALAQMLSQGQDKWLAWIAYEIVHVPQRSSDMVLIPEREAIAIHDRHAPDFPGYRSW